MAFLPHTGFTHCTAHLRTDPSLLLHTALRAIYYYLSINPYTILRQPFGFALDVPCMVYGRTVLQGILLPRCTTFLLVDMKKRRSTCLPFIYCSTPVPPLQPEPSFSRYGRWLYIPAKKRHGVAYTAVVHIPDSQLFWYGTFNSLLNDSTPPTACSSLTYGLWRGVVCRLCTWRKQHSLLCGRKRAPTGRICVVVSPFRTGKSMALAALLLPMNIVPS